MSKTSETIRERYGPDFWSRNGTKGGGTKTDKPKGFATMDRETVRELARKGGKTPKRKKDLK